MSSVTAQNVAVIATMWKNKTELNGQTIGIKRAPVQEKFVIHQNVHNVDKKIPSHELLTSMVSEQNQKRKAHT